MDERQLLPASARWQASNSRYYFLDCQQCNLPAVGEEVMRVEGNTKLISLARSDVASLSVPGEARI